MTTPWAHLHDLPTEFWKGSPNSPEPLDLGIPWVSWSQHNQNSESSLQSTPACSSSCHEQDHYSLGESGSNLHLLLSESPGPADSASMRSLAPAPITAFLSEPPIQVLMTPHRATQTLTNSSLTPVSLCLHFKPSYRCQMAHLC